MRIAPIAAIGFIISSCSSYPKDNCPTVGTEAVSDCRARQTCLVRKKTSYNIGLRPTGNVPQNYGVDMGQSPVSNSYLNCVSRDLEEQRASELINSNEKKTVE